jgi:acyl-CoA reductase-like NAD-dependent aldehyde dehydrogenase
MTATIDGIDVRIPTGGLLIGDAWVEESSRDRMEHINPATGVPLASFAMGGPAEIDAAVQAARAAFPAWRDVSPVERRDIISEIARRLQEHDVELGLLRTLELGAPRKRKRGRSMAAEYFAYYAGWPDKIEGRVIPTGSNALDYTRPEPYGVIAVIIPWNGPTVAAGMKVAPALAAGNCVVLKPSEFGPLAALRFAEICLEAGLPPGVLNVVTGDGEAGDALVRHPGVDKISFTGGIATAKRIMAAAADRLTPLTLELGGKSAAIVFPDADLQTAAQIGVMTSIGSLSGQGCVLPTRMLVADSVYDQVQQLVVDAVSKLAVGDPLADGIQVGPVINAAACERILGVIEQARGDKAGELLLGGHREGGALADGYFVAPTVFGEVDNASSLAQDEIFGPVLCLERFGDDDEAVALANDTRYGLGGIVFTRDFARAHQVAARLDAGFIGINAFPPMPPNAPFGGVKQSGFGREGGEAGIQEFLRIKNVYADVTARR